MKYNIVMKTEIIPAHLKDTIINHKLSANNSIFNLEIKSLNNLINQFVNNDINLYQLSLKLNKLKLNKLKTTINEVDFLNELINNRILLDKYDVQIDNLDILDEYKLCLSVTPKFNYQTLYNYINNNDFSDYTIYDVNYDLFESNIIKILINNGATLKSLNQDNNKSYKSINNNIKDAISAIATYIIDNKLNLKDIAIISSKENFRLLKIILKLHGIDTKMNDYQVSDIAISFISLMDFYLNPTKDNYLKIISSPFKGQDNYEIIAEYLINHIDEFKLEPFNRFIDENSYYSELETKANLIHLKYIEEMKHLLSLDFTDAIIYSFDLIKDTSRSTIKIKNIIETYKNNLKDSYSIYRPLILSIKESDTNDGVLVYDYQHDIYLKDYLFVLDPNINIIPGFNPLSGFINEDTMLNTNYPSLEERYNQHLASFNYLKASKHTIYFLIKSSLDGKSIEYDEMITNHEEIKIDTISNEYHNYINYNHHLSMENARRCFFKDDEAKGSVSSFEKYFSCPYSYFLNYGLRLYDPQKYELSSALTGTLIHEVMENLVISKSKEYYLDYEKILDNTILKYFKSLSHIFPNDIKIIKSALKRIRDSIILEMNFIKDMEENTDFVPTKAEYRFDHLMIDGELKLRLRGIIDRIDSYVDEFRIIDYKTSIHNLDKKQIAKGLMLQLLTYAIIYETISKDIPSSALYLNIKHSPITLDEFSFSKTSGIIQNYYSDDDLKNKFISDHKLKGLVFNDSEALDHNYKHINTRKKDCISDGYLIDFDKTKDMIMEIYNYLLNSLKDGNISLRPSASACEWCNYHRICHFNGIKDLNPIISDIDIGVENETE